MPASARLLTTIQDAFPLGLWDALTVMTRRHFSPFKVFIAREHRIVVILNPKVGSTSFRYITQRAYREILGRKDVSNGRYKLFKKARDFPFSPVQDYFHAFSHPKEYDFYCFVRNPYTRLKSAWVDKLAFGHNTGYPRGIRDELTRIRRFACEHALPGREEGSVVPFPTFVAYIDAQNTGERNHHWDEQYSILFIDCIRYCRIFKMETQFDEGARHILGRIGVPEAWAEEVLTKPRNQSRKFAEEVFTTDLAAQVQRIFARDFSVFDYDTDSWRGV